MKLNLYFVALLIIAIQSCSNLNQEDQEFTHYTCFNDQLIFGPDLLTVNKDVYLSNDRFIVAERSDTILDIHVDSITIDTVYYGRGINFEYKVVEKSIHYSKKGTYISDLKKDVFKMIENYSKIDGSEEFILSQTDFSCYDYLENHRGYNFRCVILPDSISYDRFVERTIKAREELAKYRDPNKY